MSAPGPPLGVQTEETQVYLKARELYRDSLALGRPLGDGWWAESPEVRRSFYDDARRALAEEPRAELLGQLEAATAGHWERNVGLNEVSCSCDLAKHMSRGEFRTHLLTLIVADLGDPA